MDAGIFAHGGCIASSMVARAASSRGLLAIRVSASIRSACTIESWLRACGRHTRPTSPDHCLMVATSSLSPSSDYSVSSTVLCSTTHRSSHVDLSICGRSIDPRQSAGVPVFARIQSLGDFGMVDGAERPSGLNSAQNSCPALEPWLCRLPGLPPEAKGTTFGPTKITHAHTCSRCNNQQCVMHRSVVKGLL